MCDTNTSPFTSTPKSAGEKVLPLVSSASRAGGARPVLCLCFLLVGNGAISSLFSSGADWLLALTTQEIVDYMAKGNFRPILNGAQSALSSL